MGKEPSEKAMLDFYDYIISKREQTTAARFDHVPKVYEQPSIEMLLLQVIQLLQTQRQGATVETQQVVQEQETLDVQEAAKYLRVSAWTIYDMCRTKTLPFFKIRARIFFRKRELDQFIDQQASKNRNK
jgi:excisionase family DNA binding protein